MFKDKAAVVKVDSIYFDCYQSMWAFEVSPFPDFSCNFLVIKNHNAIVEFKGIKGYQGISKTTLNLYHKLLKEYENMFQADMVFLIPINQAKLVTYRNVISYKLKTVIDSYRQQYYSFNQNVEFMKIYLFFQNNKS